jgi:hypothetical protein
VHGASALPLRLFLPSRQGRRPGAMTHTATVQVHARPPMQLREATAGRNGTLHTSSSRRMGVTCTPDTQSLPRTLTTLTALKLALLATVLCRTFTLLLRIADMPRLPRTAHHPFQDPTTRTLLLPTPEPPLRSMVRRRLQMDRITPKEASADGDEASLHHFTPKTVQ